MDKKAVAGFIIEAFNQQYNLNLDVLDFNVIVIPPNNNKLIGIQVSLDSLIIRTYVTISKFTAISNFKLDVTTTIVKNALGDEVYIADGYIDSTTYNILLKDFKPPAGFYSLLLEDSNEIWLENNTPLTLEQSI
jgi:hypothetical protein